MLTTVLSMMRYVSEIEDRDFVDRLNSYFTTNLLIGLSVLVSFKQFGGKPLECLTPDIFSGAWEEYTENYCWAQDTYFVSPHVVVDGMEPITRRQKRISYYQWVPFFLLLEAACFRWPSIMWKYLSGHSGIKILEIIKLSSDPNNIKPDIRRGNIKSLTTYLQGALRFHRRVKRKQIRPHGMFFLLNMPYSACYVTCMYILTKFAYLTNVFVQLMLMNSFLETHRYSFYGFGALLDLLNGTTWEQSGMFPRVSLCDFEVRVMGNIQEYTIQCVLVINIFNEKIFVFLWFWYLFVLILTLGSFLFWFGVSALPCFNRRFITRHLEMGELSFDVEANDKLIDRFVDTYLRSDGVFVIRMITFTSGVIFGTDLVLSLWQAYYGIEFHQLTRGNSFPELGELAKVLESEDEMMDAEIGKSAPMDKQGGHQLRQRHINFSASQGSRMPEMGRATADAQKHIVHANNMALMKEKLVTPPPLPAAVLNAVASRTESGVTTQTHSPTPPDVALPASRPLNVSSSSANDHERERLLSAGSITADPMSNDAHARYYETRRKQRRSNTAEQRLDGNKAANAPVLPAIYTVAATPTDGVADMTAFDEPDSKGSSDTRAKSVPERIYTSTANSTNNSSVIEVCDKIGTTALPSVASAPSVHRSDVEFALSESSDED